MPHSTRYCVAVHLMTLLASDRSAPHTSQTLSESVGTNPAVVRRLLGALTRAGLVRSQLGKGGGAQLAKGPKRISLADIFLAVEEPALIALHRSAPNQACPVGKHIQTTLTSVNQRAEKAFLKTLEAVSLKQLTKEIAAQNAAAKGAA